MSSNDDARRPGRLDRSARIYPSLVRTIHIGGIERAAGGLLVLVTAILFFAFRLNLWTPSLAVLLWVVALPALRRATKRDAQVIAVYRRHVVGAGIYLGQAPHDQVRVAPGRNRTF
jgi:type IV secretory pathway TrbD component